MAMQDLHLIHLRNHACREPGAMITVDYVYRTVKNNGGEKTLANYSISPSFVANFHNFHNIPYANELKFNSPSKIFPPNFLSTVIIRQTFLPLKFLLYGIVISQMRKLMKVIRLRKH